MKWDAFISHASEDKNFVRPLVARLLDNGMAVWYDENSLKIGESIRALIDQGLANSRFGIVVLSRNFLKKKWPQWELDGLLTKTLSGESAILPIWLDISSEEIRAISPSLANIVAARADWGIDRVADQICTRIQPEARPPTMQNVGRFLLSSQGSFDPYGLEGFLRKFADANSIFQLSVHHGPSQHEWGYVGSRESRYELIDSERNIYFAIATREKWETYSYDSKDYDRGTEVCIDAFRPLLNNLAAEAVRLLSTFPAPER
jgi:hypothetical protein